MTGSRHCGNLGRGALRGPSFKQWHFSVFKNTPITERVRLQRRAEFFNFVNHPNFSSPIVAGFISDPATKGIDASGRGICNLALTATGDVGHRQPGFSGAGVRGGAICG